MPDHEHIKLDGRIGDIFAHRFVIETASGRVLADLGPKGAERFTLKTGDAITVEGEMKPSELKVATIARADQPPVKIDHKTPAHHEHAEPREACKSVERAGFEPLGEPRRKPKHFEVLTRKGGRFVECHVAFDGHIRKEKPIAPHDEKWSQDIARAA